MKRHIDWLCVALSIALLSISGDALARGFGGGGFHGGGGFGGGGFDRGGGGFGGGGFDRGGNFGGGGSFDRGGGFDSGGFDRGGAYGGGSLDRGGFSGGAGDFGADRFGGYGGDRYGNAGDRAATGDRTAAGDRNWQSAYDGTRFAGDGGLGRYAGFNGAAANHVTANWSQGDIANRAGAVRNNFGYYNCFNHGWYAGHPGAWFAAGWGAGAAWNWATWPVAAAWCGIAAAPAYYDYGGTIVYQNDNVYYDGQDICTAEQYAQTGTTLADQGQQADSPATDQWQPLGVFALVQGNESTSNNLFQLAVNKQGIIRGNYYDGLMDTTTPVYGSVDKTNQRAAWTIGKKNDRVFETGIDNLTKQQTPVLVHFGTDKTQQWLLVRVEQPQQGSAPSGNGS